MLAQVHVRSSAGGVLQIESLVIMTAGYDVDYAGHGVAAVKCTACSLYNLYVVYVVRVNPAQVILAAVVTVKAFAVNHYQNVVVAQSVQGHLAAHVAGIEIKSGA